MNDNILHKIKRFIFKLKLEHMYIIKHEMTGDRNSFHDYSDLEIHTKNIKKIHNELKSYCKRNKITISKSTNGVGVGFCFKYKKTDITREIMKPY